MGHSPGQRIPNHRAANLRRLYTPGGRGEHRGALRHPHPLAFAPRPRRRAAARAAHRAHRPGSLDRPALRGARLLRLQERGRRAGGYRRLRGGAGGGARGTMRARSAARPRSATRSPSSGRGPAQTARSISTACAYSRETRGRRRCAAWWIRCSRRRRKASTSHPGEGGSGAMVAPSLRLRRGPSGTVGAAPRRRMRSSCATVQAPAPPASPSGGATRSRVDRASRRSCVQCGRH